MFYVTMLIELYNYRKPPKICTTENYPLYGISLLNLISLRLMYGVFLAAEMDAPSDTGSIIDRRESFSPACTHTHTHTHTTHTHTHAQTSKS